MGKRAVGIRLKCFLVLILVARSVIATRCMWLVVGLVGGVVGWLWAAGEFQKEIYALLGYENTKLDLSLHNNAGEHSCLNF